MSRTALRRQFLQEITLPPDAAGPLFALVVDPVYGSDSFRALETVLPRLLALDARLVVMGRNDHPALPDFRLFQKRHPARCAVLTETERVGLTPRSLLAAADFALFPVSMPDWSFMLTLALEQGCRPVVNVSSSPAIRRRLPDSGTEPDAAALLVFVPGAEAFWDGVRRAIALHRAASAAV